MSDTMNQLCITIRDLSLKVENKNSNTNIDFSLIYEDLPIQTMEKFHNFEIKIAGDTSYKDLVVSILNNMNCPSEKQHIWYKMKQLYSFIFQDINIR